MRHSGIELLADQLRVGALLDRAVRELLNGEGFAADVTRLFAGVSANETDVWILLVMSGQLDDRPGYRSRPRSAAEIAAQLGYSRARVGVRLPALIRQQLAESAEGEFLDGRRKRYVLLPMGVRFAARLAREVAGLEREVRLAGGLSHRIRAVDPHRVALGLCPEREHSPEAQWLDLERLRPRKRTIG